MTVSRLWNEIVPTGNSHPLLSFFLFSGVDDWWYDFMWTSRYRAAACFLLFLTATNKRKETSTGG